MKTRLAMAILAVFSVLMLVSPAANAAGAVFGNDTVCNSRGGGSAGCVDQGGANPIVPILTKAIDFGALIGGIVATIFVVVGGVKYVFSSGESEKLESARSTIIYAIVGLFVIAVARTIIRFILGRVNP